MSSTNTGEVFGAIFENNAWGSAESVSGPGSELVNVRQLLRELPGLLRDVGVTSMLDVPCGDFNWMRHVPLGQIEYVGADIVDVLIDSNRAQHGQTNRTFVKLDLLSDALPKSDLILCRDCLFHFSIDDVFKALNAFCDSGSKWLLTTTMIYRSLLRNVPIKTGEWTPLNLEMAPYHLPPPRRLILEGNVTEVCQYTVNDVTFNSPQNDRCLGLWFLDDVAETLVRLGKRVQKAGVR